MAGAFQPLAPDIPLATVTHRHPRFSLTLRICPNPNHDVLRLEVDLQGDPALRPFVLLAPHLGGTGWNNQASAASHRERRILSAQQGSFALALLGVDADFRDALGATSAGYVGESDGWQDICDLPSQPVGLELHGITLTADIPCGHRCLDFTWQWREGGWQGEDFGIDLAG